MYKIYRKYTTNNYLTYNFIFFILILDLSCQLKTQR